MTDINNGASISEPDELFIDNLTSSLGFLARAAYLQIGDLIRVRGGLTVSPPMLSALTLIHDNPGIRQVQVARILLIHESNTATLVREMIGNGLIERKKGTGKRGGLWITGAGIETLGQSIPATEISRGYAGCLSDDEYQQLITLLGRTYRARL